MYLTHLDCLGLTECVKGQENLANLEYSLDQEGAPTPPPGPLRDSGTPHTHPSLSDWGQHTITEEGMVIDRFESGEEPPAIAPTALPPYHDLLPAIGSQLEPDTELGMTIHSIPFQTKQDVFRLCKVFPFGCPSYSPDDVIALGHLSDRATLEKKKV